MQKQAVFLPIGEFSDNLLISRQKESNTITLVESARNGHKKFEDPEKNKRTFICRQKTRGNIIFKPREEATVFGVSCDL